MKKLHLLTLLVAVLIVFGAAAAQAAKVNVCHFPPGNPANFHTIAVSTNAVNAHLGHGDLEGTCLENCELICTDGDYCTQDVQADPDACICLAAPRPAVDCDDSNPCTADTCDSGVGACLNNADILDGTVCDDGDADTENDVCTSGVCAGEADNGCPCWTEAELDLIADGEVTSCGPGFQGWWLSGTSTEEISCPFPPCNTENASVFNDGPFGVYCNYANQPATNVTLPVTPDQFDACVVSIQAECAAREWCGFGQCQNGSCSPEFSCECDPGWTGEFCEIDIDECESSPCVNGDCQDQINAYLCECYPDWTGTNCDIPNVCIDDPDPSAQCTTPNQACTTQNGFAGFCGPFQNLACLCDSGPA